MSHPSLYTQSPNRIGPGHFRCRAPPASGQWQALCGRRPVPALNRLRSGHLFLQEGERPPDRLKTAIDELAPSTNTFARVLRLKLSPFDYLLGLGTADPAH